MGSGTEGCPAGSAKSTANKYKDLCVKTGNTSPSDVATAAGWPWWVPPSQQYRMLDHDFELVSLNHDEREHIEGAKEIIIDGVHVLRD